jgi:DNA-binding NtrC family response regulator
MTSEVLTGLSVLVLEDEPLWRRHLVASLERWGAEVTATDSVAGARKALGSANFDFALMDVNLPDGLGPDLLRDKSIPAHTGVVIMTAEGGISGAVEAIRLGALDYLTKPFEPEALALTLRRARSTQAGRRVAEQQRAESPGYFFGNALAGLKTQIERILAADRRMETHLAPVLIEGETGTGKTSLARRIHREGPRVEGPWVEINCSAIPEHLAESELFGHEKGAFTDARTTRIGLFEAAHGGTLFLDELGSLSLPIQAKLLTVLEDHRIRRVGGSKNIAVDVRVIAATNQGLRQLVAQGGFRSDLLHRLDLFRLSIPPLRDRGLDLLPLAASLVEGIAALTMGILPWVFVAQYGLAGAGMAFFAGYLAYLVLMLGISRRRAGVWLDRFTLVISLAGAGALGLAKLAAAGLGGGWYGLIPVGAIALVCGGIYVRVLARERTSVNEV